MFWWVELCTIKVYFMFLLKNRFTFQIFGKGKNNLLRFLSISCPIQQQTYLKLYQTLEGIKIKIRTVNKFCSKYTVVLFSSFPVAIAAEKTFRSWAAAWWMHSSRSFPADLDWLRLCHKFKSASTSLHPSSPDKHNNTGVRSWRGGGGADRRLTGSRKKHQYWQPYTLTHCSAKFCALLHVLLLLFKTRTTTAATPVQYSVMHVKK